MPENHLLDIGFNLRHRIGQLVVGVVNFFRTNAVLHRNRNGDEHVIFCFRLHGQSDLIHAQAHDAGHGIEEGPLPVQSRLGDAKKLAKSCDDGHFGGAHCEKAGEDQVQRNQSRDYQRYPVKLIHFVSSICSFLSKPDYTLPCLQRDARLARMLGPVCVALGLDQQLLLVGNDPSLALPIV